METKINPLIEYFYLFGLNTDTINNPEFYKENNFLKSEFLQPNVLSKFPPIKKPNVDIDTNIIISHCFPKGFQLLESSTVPKDEVFHFSLNNVPSRHSKNKNIFYTCLLFYEALSGYYNIQKAINKDSLNSNNKNISEDIRSKNKKLTVDPRIKVSFNRNNNFLFNNYFSPKVICFCSFIPFPSEFKYLLTKLKDYCLGIIGRITIPIEKLIENLVVAIPRPIRGRFNVKIKKDYFLLNGEDNDLDITQCDFNQYNYHSYKYQLIYEFSIDEIIEIYKCLLLEIPLLFFSKNKEKLTNIVHSFLELLSPFRYQYPHVAILPDDYIGIIEHSKSFVLGINQNWIDPETNENFFERKKILIFNKPIRICIIDYFDRPKLDLYYNKKDEGSVITFEDLGKTNTNSDNNNNIVNNVDSNINNNNTDINNINSSNVKVNEFNYSFIGNQLPNHYTEKLKKKLKIEKEKIDKKNKDKYDPLLNKIIGEETFYYFLASVFQDYNNCLFNTEKEVEAINEEIFNQTVYNIPIERIFKIAEFHSCNKREDYKFFDSFVNTNIFRNFLGRKYMNTENDKYLFLHFDETILNKKNKKFFQKKSDTEFIGDQGLKTNSWYILDKSNNPIYFSEEETNIIKENKKRLVNYYQIVGVTDFKYLLFPILLYDNVFFNNKRYQMKNYLNFSNTQLKTCLFESNDILYKIQNAKLLNIYNTEVLSQYKHNLNKSLYPNEIENSIYLLWLRMFCMTFYYCDNNEKYLRFYEMIKIIKKTRFLEDNILSLILATIAKYGDEYMIITFFEYMKNFTYGDYAYLANKLLDRKGVKSKNIILKNIPISNTGLNLFYYKNIKEQPFNFPLLSEIKNDFSKNIKQRTFFSGNNSIYNSGNDEIEYLRIDNSIICNNCNNKMDIAKLTINFGNMTKFEKLRCEKCHQEIEPQVKVRLGDNCFSIKLYGPYYLYNEISSNLMNHYGNELNLDSLRDKYNAFLYNCCWYFNIMGISYNMMLKYKNDNKINSTKKEETAQNTRKRKARFTALQIIKTNE
jgi:hypothetical protein